MLGLLGDIWDAIRSIPFLLADFMVMIVNGIVAALAAIATGVFSLLPSMPTEPDSPPAGVVGLLSWFAPVGGMVAIFSALVTAVVAFLAVRAILNWAKLL